MKKITIKLKAKHFKGTDYLDNENCAMCKAIKEQVEGVETVSEGVDLVKINDQEYNHGVYDFERFLGDQETACKMKPESVVRKIVLTKMED